VSGSHACSPEIRLHVQGIGPEWQWLPEAGSTQIRTADGPDTTPPPAPQVDSVQTRALPPEEQSSCASEQITLDVRFDRHDRPARPGPGPVAPTPPYTPHTHALTHR